ncbi:MAG: hypothetical protein ACRC2K_03250 [Clostridium sp.]
MNKNKLKKIIICMLLSVTLQCAVLLYFDKVLLREATKFTIANVEAPTQKVETTAEIPSGAEKIAISYSGKYISYFMDKKLMLVNTKSLESNQILNTMDILNATWVPNNNTLFILANEGGMVKVKTYNATNGTVQAVCDICNYKDGMSFNSFISVSAEYVSIENNGNTSIYRIDIDKNFKKLDKPITTLASAHVFWQRDVFLYQDSLDGKIYRYTNGTSKELNLPNQNRLVILKTAGNSIYLGEYSSDNKISKIIYGEDETDPSTWKSQVLETPLDVKDIYINENNEIFTNDSGNNKLKDLTTGSDIPYSGSLVCVNDRLVFSLDDGKVCLKSIKK